MSTDYKIGPLSQGGTQEGNYKDMFLYHPTPMWIFELETLKILEVNDAALKQYEYSREEFLSLSAKDLRPDYEVESFIRDVEANRGVVNYAGDWIHKKKNGANIIVNIISFPFTFKGKEARHVMATDVTEERKLANSLRTSEERFRLIVEGAPDPIFIQTEGIFVYVNNATVTLFKAASENELIGKKVIDLVHPKCREVVEKRMFRVNIKREQVKELVEIRFSALDGSDIWVETAAQPVEYDGKKGGLVFVRDLTARKQVNAELDYRNYLLNEMGAIAKIGGWEFNTETGEGTWTEEVARIHGLDPKDQTSRDIGLTFYTDESRERVARAIANAITNKVPYDLELELITKNGVHKWVHTFGYPVIEDDRVIRLRGSFQDITQRKESEKALIDSEQKYKAFFENSLDAMVLSNPQGDIIEVNQATCQLLGYKEEELKKLKRSDIIDPTDENLAPFLERRRSVGLAVGELRFVRKDGKIVDAELSSAIFHDAEGKEKTSMIIRDVSSRKKAEQEIRQLNAELEERIAERTAQLRAVNKDLEAFAYSVSHDLRTPLRGINGLTQILQENYFDKLDDEGVRLTERIRANSLKMTTLIEDLLSFSRTSISEVRRSNIDMNILVRNAIAEVGDKSTLSRAKIKLEKLPNINGDSALLKQVWINLISNAVKFSSLKENPTIEINGYQQDSKCYYEIKDNGAGFNMEYADKLFAAFQRLHSEKEFQGTGAGLAIVQRILHKHGGDIWANSVEGKGATFTFCLPVKKK